MGEKNISKILELNRRIERLSILVEVSTLLNSTLASDEILDIIMKASKKVTEAEAATLFLLDEKTNILSAEFAYGKGAGKIKRCLSVKVGEGVVGWCALKRKPVIVNDPENDKRFMCDIDKKTGFKTRSIICVPLIYKDKLIGIAQALNKKNGDFTEEDIDIFSRFANQAAVAVETSRLYKERLEMQHMEHELKFARLIQDSFLPDFRNLLWGICHIGVKRYTAFNVSGDFFDFFHINDEKIFFVLGDVSGKGIPAAIFMANLLSRIRHYALKYKSLVNIVTAINRDCYNLKQRGMFTTAIVGLWNISDNFIEWVNCGHLPLFFYNSANGGWNIFKNNDNIPLGIMPDFKYKKQRTCFYTGDCILMASDGIIETTNKSGKELGLEGFIKILPMKLDVPQKMVEYLYEFVKDYKGDEHFRDDITILAIKNSHIDKGFTVEINALPENLSIIRRYVKQYLQYYHLVDETLENRLILAVDEAVTNIIKYSYQGRKKGKVSIELNHDKGAVVFKIRDYGRPFRENLDVSGCDNNNLNPGGLGLILIKKIMDEVKYCPKKKGTVLIMKKYI